MNDCRPPEERAFPAALLRKQKEYLMNEITRDQQTHPRRSQSLVLRFAIALAVIAMTVACISVFGGDGPLQPLTMAQALEAITPAEGEILHIKTSTDLMVEYHLPGDSGPSGYVTDGTPRVEEIWSRSDSPWGWRWAMGGAGLDLQEWAAYSTGRRLFYDSKTNSMLEIQDDTLLEGVKLKPPEEGYLTMIRWLLESGQAVQDGHEQVDGRDALRIVEKPAPDNGVYAENVYLVDAKTGEPIEYRMMNEGSTIRFVIYEKLPGTPENLALLDLKAAYPGATMYTDWREWDLVVQHRGAF